MAGSNINRVIITGNLTRDPEMKALPSGSAVCSLRIACNGRRKNNDTGMWEEVPNYFDVSVWGAQGENCGKYLKKGRGVAVDVVRRVAMHAHHAEHRLAVLRVAREGPLRRRHLRAEVARRVTRGALRVRQPERLRFGRYAHRHDARAVSALELCLHLRQPAIECQNEAR